MLEMFSSHNCCCHRVTKIVNTKRDQQHIEGSFVELLDCQRCQLQ